MLTGDRGSKKKKDSKDMGKKFIKKCPPGGLAQTKKHGYSKKKDAAGMDDGFQ